MIYINDLDSDVRGYVGQTADGTKVGRLIRTAHNAKVLQGGLDRLHECAGMWRVENNVRKCSSLGVGRNLTYITAF